MQIKVKKFGGASLATADKLRAIALTVAEESKQVRQVIVVSAMGKTTENLLGLAGSSVTDLRSLDRLLATGEEVSASLLSLHLNEAGVPAKMLTGGEAGIITDGKHRDARIIRVDPAEIRKLLEEGIMPVVTGFQGVSLRGEITTLGRGGSDLTAVAIAAALGRVRCEILKEAPAIFSADPNCIPEAVPINELTYAQLGEMTRGGARVLQTRAVTLAEKAGVPLFVGPANGSESGTTVLNFVHQEKEEFLSVNIHGTVVARTYEFMDKESSRAEFLKETFGAQERPEILSVRETDYGSTVYATAPAEVLEGLFTSGHLERLSSVTATYTSAPDEARIHKLLDLLRREGLAVHDWVKGEYSLTFILGAGEWEIAQGTIHRHCLENGHFMGTEIVIPTEVLAAEGSISV